MAADYEIWELREQIQDALQTNTYLSGKEIAVFLDSGNLKDQEEEQLRTKGAVISVFYPSEGKTRAVSGTGLAMDIMINVELSVNISQNESDNGAGLDTFRAVFEVLKAVRGINRHNGGEFFRVDATAWDTVDFDNGLQSTMFYFTKEETRF